MSENKRFYNAYAGGHVSPGEKIEVSCTVYYQRRDAAADLAAFTQLPADKLKELREVSAAREQEIYNDALHHVRVWEKQAANTMLIDKAIEYLATKEVEHTSNKWAINAVGNNEISNMVYKFYFCISPQTMRKSDEPHAYEVTWNLSTNYVKGGDSRYGTTIAGQRGKRYGDKAAAEKYVNGRFKAYANLFTSISPSIPPEYIHDFSVNGLLKPGYTVQGQEPIRPLSVAPITESIIVGDAPAWTKKPKKEKTPAPKGRTGPAI